MKRSDVWMLGFLIVGAPTRGPILTFMWLTVCLVLWLYFLWKGK